MAMPRPRLGRTVRRLMVATAVVALVLGGGLHARRWQRLRRAARRCVAQRAFFDEGRITIDRYVEASRQVLDAELALCATTPRRAVAHALHIARVEAIIVADRRMTPIESHCHSSFSDREVAATDIEADRERLAALLAATYGPPGGDRAAGSGQPAPPGADRHAGSNGRFNRGRDAIGRAGVAMAGRSYDNCQTMTIVRPPEVRSMAQPTEPPAGASAGRDEVAPVAARGPIAARWPRASGWPLAALAVLVAVAWTSAGALRASRADRADGPVGVVAARRVELRTELVAGGDLQPIKETSVACQVEDLTKAGGIVLVSVIPNGATVRKGDELCRLDSSDLEDLARQVELDVNQARATRDQARLTHECAVIELREYQDGVVGQTTKELEGRIALARAGTTSGEDRLAWVRSMLAKGYASKADLAMTTQSAAKAAHALRLAELGLHTFRQYESPRQLFALQTEIEKTASVYRFEAEKLQAQEGRLAHIRTQVANCRVVAPHDGIAVYGGRHTWRPVQLEAGARILQGQELFTLPDLSRVEVDVSIHETMGRRVRVGQAASVQVASRGDESFPGKVVSITLLPIPNDKEWDERLRHYIARVRLDETPRGVLPLMSATVKIDTGRVPGALVVPIEAVATLGADAACYVVAGDRVERRAVTLGAATPDLVEVVAGLEDGDLVAPRAADGARVAARLGR